jgi:hypothetical protein
VSCRRGSVIASLLVRLMGGDTCRGLTGAAFGGFCGVGFCGVGFCGVGLGGVGVGDTGAIHTISPAFDGGLSLMMVSGFIRISAMTRMCRPIAMARPVRLGLLSPYRRLWGPYGGITWPQVGQNSSGPWVWLDWSKINRFLCANRQYRAWSGKLTRACR